eukprot:6479080-Amphidinium_carterae.2
MGCWNAKLSGTVIHACETRIDKVVPSSCRDETSVRVQVRASARASPRPSCQPLMRLIFHCTPPPFNVFRALEVESAVRGSSCKHVQRIWEVPRQSAVVQSPK